jgi:hypothetical protein
VRVERLLLRRYIALGAMAVALVVLINQHSDIGRHGRSRPATAATGSASDSVSRATQQLIAQCMRDAGFAYPVVERPEYTPRPLADLPFGTDDVAWARIHGFGSAESAAAQERIVDAQHRSPMGRYLASLTATQKARFQIVLHGDPNTARITAPLPIGGQLFTAAEGCWASAERTLYPDRVAWFRAQAIADALPVLSIRETLRDSRYVAVQVKWSVCMEKAGVAARTGLNDLVSSVAERVRALPASAGARIERQVAMVSATCSAETGLTHVGESTRTDILSALRLRYHQPLSELDRQLRVAAQRASTMIGGRAP